MVASQPRPTSSWWAAARPGLVAAVAAARNGAKVTLVERYAHLGGLASGGMVLVLDDMWTANGSEITVQGICQEMIDRMAAMRLAVFPPEDDGARGPSRSSGAGPGGVPSTSTARSKPHPSATPLPSTRTDGSAPRWRLVQENGIHLRLHSWFSAHAGRGRPVEGVVCETKSDRQAIRGDVVIDSTGDLDVASSRRCAVHRRQLHPDHGVPTGRSRHRRRGAFEYEAPETYAEVDRRSSEILGGSWD